MASNSSQIIYPNHADRSRQYKSSNSKSLEDTKRHRLRKKETLDYNSNQSSTLPNSASTVSTSSSTSRTRKFQNAVKRLHSNFGRRSRSQGPSADRGNIHSGYYPNTSDGMPSSISLHHRSSVGSNDHLNLLLKSSPSGMSENFVETNAYRTGFTSPVKPYSSSNIFCVPLDSLKMTEEELENHRQRQVPEIIFALGEVLKNHAQITEGIFRLSSTNRNIRRLKESLELASNQVNSLLAFKSELTNSSEPHAIATVLKHLVRDLPEPLIPAENYKDFLRICDDENMKKIDGKSEIKIPELRKQIAKLPKVNHDVLHYLVELMIAVEEYKDVNKMGAKALSVVFGPNIFRVSDGMEGLKEQAVTNRLVQEMINNYDKLFLPNKPEINVNHHSSTDSAIHVNDSQFSPEIRNLIKDRLHNFVFGNSNSKSSEKGDYFIW